MSDSSNADAAARRQEKIRAHLLALAYQEASAEAGRHDLAQLPPLSAQDLDYFQKRLGDWLQQLRSQLPASAGEAAAPAGSAGGFVDRVERGEGGPRTP